MKNVEIEIQVKIENPNPLLDLMEKEGQFISEEKEIDEYFTPAHKDYREARPLIEWLRLRNDDGKYTTCYKNWHKDKNNKTHHCDEIEVEIKDFDEMRKLYLALGCKPIVKVNKIRKKYLWGNYEIALDEVEGLGSSAEIEYKGQTDKKPAEITDEMIRFLKNLKVGKILRSFQGYAFILMFPDEAIFEEV